MHRIGVSLSVVVAIVVTAACGGGESAAPDAGSKETTAATTANNTLPEQPGPMPAGRYATEQFEPAFSFEVGKGWNIMIPEMRTALGIGSEPDEGIAFTKTRRVFDPSKPSRPETVSAPENAGAWISWFQKHPNLETSKPKPVTIGNVSGMRIDVRASSVPRNYPHECGDLAPCVLLYPFGEIDIMASYVGYLDRFIALDVNGEVVVVDIGAPSDNFGDFSPRAQKVLDTVKWETTS